MASPPGTASDDARRALHWVLKIGNLRDTLQFMGSVFGMRTLRHEEFATGCEATCNGPYGGRWSKTMCGFGSEDRCFALELTYNYGIDSYSRGTHLRCIGVRSLMSPKPADGLEPEFAPFGRALQLEAARTLGASVVEADDGVMVESPDGCAFKLIDDSSASAQPEDPVLLVSLWVSDLAASTAFYTDAMGMAAVDGATVAGATATHTAAWLRFPGSPGPALELVQVSEGVRVSRGDDFGRLAIATGANPSRIHEGLSARGLLLARDEEGGVPSAGKVIHEPVRLTTPGKADVDVVIVGDPDGHEICLVGAAGFEALARQRPGDDFVNWRARAAMGADGHPPPEVSPELRAAHASGRLGAVADIPSEGVLSKAIEGACGNDEGVMVVKAYGEWCKHCAKISPRYEAMAADLTARGSAASFAQVDIDSVPSVIGMVDGGLTRVPAFLALRGGSVVDSYIGSSERRLARFLWRVAPTPDGGGITLADGRMVSGESPAPSPRIPVDDAGGGGCPCAHSASAAASVSSESDEGGCSALGSRADC